MKKYFILFLSVLLLVVCGCKHEGGSTGKPSFSVNPSEDGLIIKVSCATKYKHGIVSVWDRNNGRYNLSVDITGAGELIYELVEPGNKYNVKVELYQDDNGSWTNYYNLGWSDPVVSAGGIGNYSVSGDGLSYDAENNTISINDYNVYNGTEITYGYGFAYLYTTNSDSVWDNYNYYCPFQSWSGEDGNNNLNVQTGVAKFDSILNKDVLEDLAENKHKFWYRYYYRIKYYDTLYYWCYDPQVLMTYGKSSENFAGDSSFIKVSSSVDGFTITKAQNYNYPNVRITVYNVTDENNIYECPRIVKDSPYAVMQYDYIQANDVYDVKVQIWDKNWGSYWESTIYGITARGGKGNLGFKYNSAEYNQGTDVANIVLNDAMFIGSRMPENYTMNGNLWYSSNNQDFNNNAYYNDFKSTYDSTEKIFTIDVNKLVPTIRGLYFYPELVSEWEYNGTKYQLTIIDDEEAVMKDTHVKPESYELDKEFNFVPEYGNFEVADELQDKKAYLIKYNKNSSEVNDSCIIKNASILEESLSKARSAAEDAISKGVVPDTIRRWEVDFVGYDFGEPIGPKNVSRNAVPLANYDDYVVDVTSDNFLIQNEKDSKFYEHKATLKAIGKHCNVWYVNNNKLAHEVLQAAIADKKTGFQTVADKFDTFFEYETYLAGSNVPAKDYWDIIDIDDSVKIDILICDIDEQYKDGMNGGVYGYFWSKDMTLQTQIASSNERQMIYIDSAFLGKDPVYMYATLSHEFQHLLLYVNKWLNKKLDFPTWYTEMMSLGMEDVLQIACLGYKNNEAISGRVYSFNGGYNAGFVDWGKMNGSVYYSYANAAIFMDYLLKNYGGVDLYYEIAHNNYVGQESITKALQKLGYNETFDTVMMKMGQVIVNSFAATLPADAITVNKKASSTLNINGKDVVFKFNELDLKNYSHDNSTKNYNTADRYLNYSFDYKGSDGKPYYYGGPSVLLPNKNFTKIYSNAITVNLISETPSKIQLYNPGNNIEMAVYLCDVYNK